MCGIYGIVGAERLSDMEAALQRMYTAQAHRGPDGNGRQVKQVGSHSVALGHQRLAILDLSSAGLQPMTSASGRSVLTYNGEIYNYQELRHDLLERPLHSETDTEVALEVLERVGIADASRMFNGMWAFALLDTESRKLYLGRDRVGIKPLHYTIRDDTFFFASELKTLLAGADRPFALDMSAVSEYLDRSTQDTRPNTFFTDIKSIPPGCFAAIDLDTPVLNIELHRYWEPATIGAELSELDADPSPASVEHAVKQTRDLFIDAVRLHMRSDVPIGLTLSGGVDSTAIAAVMKASLAPGQSMTVLSAVSPGSLEDESHFIDIAAREIGLRVEKLHVDWLPEDTFALMRKATWHNDTPLGSLSNVAFYLLMQKARELGVTVVLSGQGADELLCGYKKYLGFRLQSLLEAFRPIRALRVYAEFARNRTILAQFKLDQAKRYLPAFMRMRHLDIRGERLRGEKTPSLRKAPGETVRDRQVSDLMAYSVPFLTHYEDRMSMAHGREIRLPYLDFRFMEHLLKMPVSLKLRSGWTKWVFREALADLMPKSIAWRRDKIGFTGPQQEWLRNELRAEIEKIMSPDAHVFRQRLIDRPAWLETYARYVGESRKGLPVWYREVFAPLALEIWLQTFDRYIEKPAD